MCAQARAVVSTVGPYALYGEPLVKACAEEAGLQLGVIRRIVAVNLALGLITVAIGASGRFWV